MSRCYIIAELGLSHRGDARAACRAVQAFADAGADAVKFQDHRWQVVPEEQAHPSPHVKVTRAEWYRRTAFPEPHWRQIRDACRMCGVDYIVSPFSVEALREQVKLEPRYIKIASGEVTNRELVAEALRCDIPLLYSLGMLCDADTRLVISEARAMTCTSEYPCAPEHSRLAERVYCSFSDHTAGTWFPIAAVARGATMIEKHVHLDASQPHSDSDIALTPDKFRVMVEGIRAVEKALYEPSEPDLTEIRSIYLHGGA